MFSWLVSSEEALRDDSFSFGKLMESSTDVTDEAIGSDDDDEAGYEFELLVQAYMRDNHYQSRHQAMANIVYGTLNAGFVALPYACYEVGIPLYVCCITAVSIIAGYTTTMVIKLANDQKGVAGRGSIPRTLEDLSEIAFGFGGYCLVATMQILLSLTLMCMSLDVWGEIMSSILSCRLQNIRMNSYLHWFLTERTGQVLIGSSIIFPLLLYSDTVSSLKWTAYTTIICIASAFVAVLASFAIADSDILDSGDDSLGNEITEIKSQWWVVCLIVTLCFSYNQKAFSVYSCLRRRSSTRWNFSVKRANGLIFCIYVLFGILGYLAHVRKLERFNFFLDFDGQNNLVFDITRGMVAFGLLLAFPMDALVASTTARRLWRRVANNQRKVIGSEILPPNMIEYETNVDETDNKNYNANAYDIEDDLRTLSGMSSITPEPVVFKSEPCNSNLNGGNKSEADIIENQDYSPTIDMRHSSVGDRREVDIIHFFGMNVSTTVPVMATFWAIGTTLAVAVDAGVVMAATIGGISTSLMVFVLPSMLYFKLGLTSDFQASPVIGSCISNRLYMTITQVLGSILFLGNIGFIIYWLSNPEVSFNNVISKTVK